ncbi:GCN5 family acetyltransferase [Pedobacter sp. Leaf216]|uniref:GNAT family N-acetyltransferase n=1 Tax=Pedobacter sp. Leaf216 TaxID=1735684 RepID=UPI0006F9BD9E|nr:GNAT family N-acetyltransferase [Pedobacter sp. Leaf216]KQM69537.1 GCN5 family acetyltransferase [Pedobacter sp. Leaf216]
MTTEIYLRPLALKDAEVSYRWRNDPEVWLYTKFMLKQPITAEIEKQWLLNKLDLTNEKRFAICVKNTNEYIGNIQLLDIANETAEFHLFIGEKKYWGKGIGYHASLMLLKYAFYNLNLKNVFLEVHAENLAAYSIYKKVGFQPVSQQSDFIKMVINASVLATIH